RVKSGFGDRTGGGGRRTRACRPLRFSTRAVVRQLLREAPYPERGKSGKEGLSAVDDGFFSRPVGAGLFRSWNRHSRLYVASAVLPPVTKIDHQVTKRESLLSRVEP